ncbi:MAG: hypothetical protein AB7F98_06680 [Novosphingobium sp.]
MMTGTIDRLRTSAPLLALGTFVLMLLAGLLLPVYTDEIGWRFQERAAIDGLDIMFNDLCGPNTIVHAPWFMMPVRFFSAMANQALASPLFVRIEGIACALVWVVLLWRLTSRLEADSAARANLRTVLFSLLAMGILPFLMVLSRPEQPQILMLSLAMLAAFAVPATTARRAAFRSAGIVLFAWIALSYHLKGVAYFPVYLACLLACANGPRTWWPRLAGAVTLTALTLASAQYWVHRFQCSGDPVIAKKLAGENVAALLSSGGDWMSVASSIAKGTNPLYYFWLAVPGNNVNWLPSAMTMTSGSATFVLAIFFLWGGVLVCSLFSLALYCWNERLQALRERRVLIALALLGCLAAWGASQLNRNHYEAAQYLPMTIVLYAMCLTLPHRTAQWPKQVLGFFCKLGIPAALASAAAVLASAAVPLSEASSHAGWIPNLRVSVSAYGYPKVRQDIATAMDRAGMGGGQRFNRLLVDDVTYLALQHHTMPMHRLGVLGDWKGVITDPVAYLVSRNSDGVVIGCRYLPARMRMVAGKSGEVCAISRAGLQQLAASGPTRFGDGEQY